MKNFTKFLFSLLLLIHFNFSTAQVKIGDNVTTVNPNAVLELEKTDKGFLPPRMTTAQRNAISNPTQGLVVFNITNQCLEVYNATEVKWKSMCGDERDTAIYEANCSTIAAEGTYTTGILLDSTNKISIEVDVTQLGSYAIVSNAGGMVFTASGTFTTLGPQTIDLQGQGYPSTAGLNYLSFVFGNKVCSTVINVGNGIANITSCGTAAKTGTAYAGIALNLGDYSIVLSGVTYTGGTVYSISCPTVNGIKISSPLNGTISTSSPATFGLFVTGTPIVPGDTVLTYSINNQIGCTVTIPVQTGTGFANAVTCSGTLNGTYKMGQAMTSGNTKVISLANVTQVGTFNVLTNTQNGVSFSGSYSASATGAQNMTLTATGTPTAAGTFTFNVYVSSSLTTYANCSFTVTFAGTAPLCSTVGSTNLQYIKASNTEADDCFGGRLNTDAVSPYGEGKCTKMSADGLTLAVAAPMENSNASGAPLNNSADNAGAVYIYTRANLTSNFAFQAYIKAANPDSDDFFGQSIDISNDGNTLIVGSPREDGNGTGVNPTANNSGGDSGAAYVFTRSGASWSQLAYLKAPTGHYDNFDYLAGSVAVSGDGNTFALGATYEDGTATGINSAHNNNGTEIGVVYTYTRSGSTITYSSKLKPSVILANYYWFGRSVDLNDDGTTLAVGAPGEQGQGVGVNPAPSTGWGYAGAAYVFKYNGSAWSQQAYIKSSNTRWDTEFGNSVALSGDGNRLVVGAQKEDGNLVNSTSIGDSGAAYVYDRSGSTWTSKQRLKADNMDYSDVFGLRVDLSQDGSTIAVGAPYEDTRVPTSTCPTFTPNGSDAESGAIYTFKLTGGTFLQTNMYKFIYNTTTPSLGGEAVDLYGCSLSLNSDGTSLAGAAIYEDGNGLNVNPTVNNGASNSGCVLVHTN